jgi:D-sedoheptulose 7-phosphate isomerase
VTDPLAQLYGQVDPGLSDGSADGASDGMDDATLLTSIQTKAEESRRAQTAFVDRAGADLVTMARRLASVFATGGRLLTMGNGGSSCDAAHLAVEFNHPVTVGRRALPAIHLAGDVAMLTAVGNDVGFGDIFTRLVIAQGRPGDALFGFSTSGNSQNLLNAYARAKRDGLVTLGMAGGDGGRMAQSSDVDVCVVVPTPSIHRVQESHVFAYHVLWDLVHTLLAQTKVASP